MKPNLNTLTDDEVVQLFKQGSNDAFEELVLRYKNALYYYIKAMVKDEGAAEDLFQEVFVSFFKHADSYQAQGKFKSWLFLTARNKVFNFLRDHAKQVSLDETDDEGNFIWHEKIADGQAEFLDQMTRQDFILQVNRAAEKLSPAQWEIIQLRPYFSFKEIAQLTSRPLGSVLADGHRGMMKLKKILEQSALAQEETL